MIKQTTQLKIGRKSFLFPLKLKSAIFAACCLYSILGHASRTANISLKESIKFKFSDVKINDAINDINFIQQEITGTFFYIRYDYNYLDATVI